MAEGSSIRSIERMTGIHRDTVMRLGVRIGKGCAQLLVESRHLESVSVKETFQGKTVWEGVVEVFELIGHPKATKIYAWAHDTDDPEKPRRHITVLHIEPVISPLLAVRAAILQEYRSRATEES